jgi:hypothetical protein
MKRKRIHCREKRAIAAAPQVTPVTPPPTECFLAVHAITRSAEAAGWPPKQALECGMQLVCHGTTVSEAAALFDRAARWLQ